MLTRIFFLKNAIEEEKELKNKQFHKGNIIIKNINKFSIFSQPKLINIENKDKSVHKNVSQGCNEVIRS